MSNRRESVDALVHIADIHFWHVTRNPRQLINKRFIGNLNVWLNRRHQFLRARAESYADAIAATGISFALFTGDLTCTALDEEFQMAVRFVRALRERGITLALVAGNHDVYTFEARRRKRFERYFAEYLPWGGYPARLNLPGGTTLLLVPTARPNVLSSRGKVRRETLEKVKLFLESTSERVLVASHYPLLTRWGDRTVGKSRLLVNAQALRDLLGTSGKSILYLSGHEHRFDYRRDLTYPTLSHLVTGPLIRLNRRQGTQGEFSVIHVTSNGFRIERYVHENAWKHVEIPL